MSGVDERMAQAAGAKATSLDLSGLELAELPESVGNLTGPTELYLGHNSLAVLPDAIGNLTNLM